MAFAGRISELFHESALNKSEFAALFGIAPTALNHYMEGHVIPKISVVMRIADYYGFSVDYILDLTETTTFHRTKHPRSFQESFEIALAANHTNATHIAVDVLTIRSSAPTQWKKRGQYPKTEHLIVMARELHVSVEFLLGREALENEANKQ